MVFGGFDLRASSYGGDVLLRGRWAWSSSDGLRRVSGDGYVMLSTLSEVLQSPDGLLYSKPVMLKEATGLRMNALPGVAVGANRC